MNKKHNLMYALAQSAFMGMVREGEPTPPVITPEVQAIIDAQVAQRMTTEITGLKSKNEELLGKNKEFQTKLSTYDGIDVEQYREYKDRIDKDEDAALLAAGKKDEVINKHTERMRAAHDAKLVEKDQAIEQANARAKKFERAVLDNQIRQACTDMHKSAVDDALLYASQFFQLDAEGNAVKLDAQGRPEIGKDGKTPLSPAEWIESLKETKPHWFPASSSGSGSGGAAGAGAGTGQTITRAKFDALTPTDKATIAAKGVQIV